MTDPRSWFSGLCKLCGFNVVVTQPTEEFADYWWFCTNKCCENHVGNQAGDQESPEWVK